MNLLRYASKVKILTAKHVGMTVLLQKQMKRKSKIYLTFVIKRIYCRH